MSGFRDFFVLIVVMGSLPLILSRPFLGVLMWSWLSYLNPHKLSWGFAREFPFARLVAMDRAARTGGLRLAVRAFLQPAVHVGEQSFAVRAGRPGSRAMVVRTVDLDHAVHGEEFPLEPVVHP